VKDAVPRSRFLIDAASADGDLTSADGRARMASQARPLWSALPDGALKRQLITELANGTGIGSSDLLQLWQQSGGGGARAQRPAHREPSASHGSGYDGGSHTPDHGDHPGGGYTQSFSPSGGGTYGGGASSGYGKGTYGNKGYGKWRKGPPPPPRMLGQRRAGGSRADRAVGLLLANAQAWDTLSADDHAMLAHLPAPHGPVFAWLEAQLHEHGPQPWAALREALRGGEHEAFACGQVEQATMGADSALELAELADVMDRLRGDALEALAGLLAARVQQGDNSAFEEYKRVNERIKALKSAPPV
jgi:DNA primase